MRTLASYVKQVMNEEDESAEVVTDDKNGAEENKEKPEPKKEEKECDTVLTIECCGATLKKIIDAIKKTEGKFKVEIDTGDEEAEEKIEWDSEKDMIGAVKSEKKEKAE